MRISLLLLGLLVSTLSLAKTYRWVDDEGRVHYGDRIPPQYSQQESQTLNERGVVVEERNRSKTPEELERERRAKAAKEAEQRKAEEQERYDQFLLSTYSTQDQILYRRDEQLSILDARIASGEKAVEQSEKTLAELQERAQKLEKANKPIPDKLSEQIESFEESVEQGQAALDSMRAERERVHGEFERDLERFIELTQPRPGS